MPALSPQTVLDGSSCFGCYGGALIDLFELSLLDLISQNIGNVIPDPYDGLLVYTRQGLGETTVVNPIGAFNLTFGANMVTEIHCHNCPGITGITCNTNATLTVVDLETVPNLTTLVFSGATALPSLDLSLTGQTAMVQINTENCNSLTSLVAPTVTSLSSILRVGPCPLISSLNFNSLVSTPNIVLGSCPSLTSISFPSLTTVSAFFNFNASTGLVSVSCPVLESSATFGGMTLPSLTSVYAPLLTTVGTIEFIDCDSLVTLQLPLLQTAGSCFIYGNAFLATLELPELVSCDTLNFSGNVSLTSLNLDLFASAETATFNGCQVLETLSLPSFECQIYPTIFFDASACDTLNQMDIAYPLADGMEFYATVCVLNAATVNSILAQGVAGVMVGGIIDLSGGFNAAPTGQGIIDKADLITAGVAVTTN